MNINPSWNRIQFVLLALVVASVTSCSTKQKVSEQSIVGTWEMDSATTQEVHESGAKTDLEKKGAALMKGLNLKYRFVFSEDGSVTYGFMMGKMKPQAGTYQLKNLASDSADLDITFNEKTDTFRVSFLSEDEIELEIQNPSKTRIGPKVYKLKRVGGEE